MDALKIIRESYELYREQWRSVITAFIVVFLISLIFGVADALARLSKDTICKGVDNFFLVLLFCISPMILQFIFGMLNGLLNILVTMAVIKPMDEIAEGKRISNWTGHFSKQLVNSIIVMLFRVLLLLICFIPFGIVLFASVPTLVLLNGKIDAWMLLSGGLFMLTLVGMLGVLIWIIMNFLLTFLEIEVVLGGRGVLQAGVKSANLVKNNFWDVLIYSFLWLLINVVVGAASTVLALCTCCILLPVVWLITPFVIEPIQLLSKVILWKRLKS